MFGFNCNERGKFTVFYSVVCASFVCLWFPPNVVFSCRVVLCCVLFCCVVWCCLVGVVCRLAWRCRKRWFTFTYSGGWWNMNTPVEEKLR